MPGSTRACGFAECQVDAKLCYLGSREEFSKTSGKKVPMPPPVDRWLNIFDEVDVFSLAAEPIFQGVKDPRGHPQQSNSTVPPSLLSDVLAKSQLGDFGHLERHVPGIAQTFAARLGLLSRLAPSSPAGLTSDNRRKSCIAECSMTSKELIDSLLRFLELILSWPVLIFCAVLFVRKQLPSLISNLADRMTKAPWGFEFSTLQRRVDKLEEYLEERVKILPSDTWAAVVGKARALRDLGRMGEAVAAFGRYAEMFASTDPGAAAYARTAQGFTTQLKALGVTGGVYLFTVTDGGAAAHAGLRACDIVISYAGTPTPGPAEIAEIMSRFTAADPVRIDYLRQEPTGGFTLGTVSVPGGPLGMPI